MPFNFTGGQPPKLKVSAKLQTDYNYKKNEGRVQLVGHD